MILVVALLGILFVAGAAFLQIVTFQARVIQADAESREDEAVVDQVNQLVYVVLKRGFLGDGNVAYSGAGRLTDIDPATGNIVVVLPAAYGEVAGMHVILSPIEPHMNGSQELVYSVYTDLARAIDGQVGQAGASIQCASPPTYGLNMRPRDADGDGICDSSAAWDVFGSNNLAGKPLIAVPRAQWTSTVNRLRASDAMDDNVTIAVRVIPHGAMVDVNHSHPLLIANVLDDNATGAHVLDFDPNPGAYPPEIEERALRHRFLLASRSLPESGLQKALQNVNWGAPASTPLFLVALRPDLTQKTGTSDDFRWWDYSPGDAGPGGLYRELLNPNLSVPLNAGGLGDPSWARRYDRRHLITTESHDDLLIRGVRFPDNIGDARAGQDIIQWIKADPARRGRFYIDNYPFGLRGTENDTSVGAAIDPRVGRIQLSLPRLDQFLTDNGLSLDTLSAPAANAAIRDQLIYTIQNMFWVMLWNYPDLDGNGTVDAADETLRAWQAASLTANLIDFADTDDVPTPVYPLVWDEPTQRFVPPDPSHPENRAFGLERQPYITELYARTGPSGGGVSAIELYNPYSDPINLATYKIGVDAANDTDLIQLPNVVLPAGDFVVLANPASDADLNSVPATKKVDLSFPALGASSRVDLARTVTWGGETVDLVVDRFDVTDVPGSATNFGTATPASLERDMSPWRWVVPRAKEMNSHTLGQNNATADASTVDPAIRPVQVDFANTGSLSTAYPTTGCLLLLMRHAQQYAQNPAEALPFNHVQRPGGTTSAMAAEYDQIDNGRMPVFDVGSPTASQGPGSEPYYHTLTDGPNPVMDLRAIPWGQLVLDYFTALPLENQVSAVNRWSLDAKPRVDQFGLRVWGRININAAPYKVLAGLPTLCVQSMPSPFQQNILIGAHPHLAWPPPDCGQQPLTLGYGVAQAIEAYREARRVKDCESGGSCTGDYESRLQPPGTDPDTAGLRFGRGFLTVGELANVRHRAARSQSSGPTSYSDFRMDGGVVGRVNGTSPNEDYVQAVARLVLLGDWVTTRSHVFTIYGTIEGPVRTSGTPAELAQSQAEARAKAIRFEDTVDRLPCFFDPKAAPQRICQRTVGNYLEARAD